ncbi:MAG: EamA family transporter RarD, partial [Allorhizobium sp.]
MADVTAPAENRDSLNGFLFALSAYLLWGFLPLYMKAMAHISPAEVIAHRILWSVPVAGLLLLVIRQTDDLKKAIRNPRMLGMAAVTATLISVNWGIYVWAIGAGHALDTALGYFINPLFSILMGAVILKEKLKKTQIAALALVVLAVVILTVEAGRLPVVALALTFSWGFYAFFRKTLPIGPNQGFLLEVLLLSPIALGYLVYLNLQGGGHFLMGNMTDTILLASAGLVTAVPLILYANGAKLLRLSTIGIMQYIA